MRVRLNVQMSGSRNGVPWPPIGSIVELPDDEARDMLRAGTAGALDESDEPRSAVHVPADVDEATAKFIPETAQHEPAVPIETLPEDDRRPLMGNVGLADDGEIGHGPTNPPESLQPVGTESDPVDMTAATAEEGTPAPRKTAKTSDTPRVDENRDRTSAGRADGTDGSDPDNTHGETNGDDGESAGPLTTENGPSKTVRRASSRPTTRK